MLLKTARAGLAVVTGLALTGTALAQETFDSSAGPLTATVVAEGLENPWAVEFLPDGRMLVTERPGRLRIVDDAGQLSDPVEGVPQVYASGQGGLLDVAVAPDFDSSGRIYLTYAEPGEGGAGTAVMAATLVLDGAGGRLEDGEVIFRMNNFTDGGLHFGSRVEVAQDGNLFVTLGERGAMDRAQDFADLAGGIVRIGPDGSVPDDNPRLEGWAPEFYSVGHRNPQGATVRPSDGQLFAVEHGPRGGDELNLVLPGLNYGWPLVTYGVNYSGTVISDQTEGPDFESPIHHWVPSISPSGLDIVEGGLFPDWEGDIITGGLSGQTMERIEMDGDIAVGGERLFEGQLGRVRDVKIGPDGAIYVVIDAPSAPIYRIAPTL